MNTLCSSGFFVVVAAIVVTAAPLLSEEKPGKSPAQESVDKAAAALKKFRKPEVTAFRVDGGGEGSKRQPEKHGNGFVRGWPVLEEKRPVAADLRADLEKILTARENYGEAGAACFWPGMAFTWREQSSTLDAVICLKCRWVYLYESDKPQQLMLSKRGVDELDRLYRRLFKTPSTERL